MLNNNCRHNDESSRTSRQVGEQGEIDAGQRPGVATEAGEELERLRTEDADLRRPRDILKPSCLAAAEFDRRLPR